jgi:Replication-relaxation
VRYYKGYIALSETCDMPVLLHVRNARALCFDQLRELLSHDMLAAIVRSLRWRVARLERVGLLARLNEQRFLGRPVYRITHQGLECLESRGHCLVSLPSNTEQILHPSKVAHALELVDIHLAIARTGLLRSWRTDIEIASRNLVAAGGTSKDYDAIAEVEAGGCTRRIGIEYERSTKSVARYAAIREALDNDTATDLVFYLAASDDLLYLLAMELRAARKSIAFALSDQFRRSPLETRILTNRADSEFVSFCELLNLKHP